MSGLVEMSYLFVPIIYNYTHKNKNTICFQEDFVKEDTRREARVAMMEANKNALQSMYTVDDNLMTVFVFESGIATIYSFTEEPKVINL